ncbi:MAG: hypothetical protein NTY90_01825 [Candidatus Micrarchaeota archaeon]|nr:hypothetical protein [Candidatus Micrarchaeota archaeon]
MQTKPRTRAEERADTKGASKLFGAATSQIVTIRSLFMASEFLRHSREQHAPMVLVTGAGHASQLHRFIENPRMALNYIRLIRGPLQKLPDLNQLERNDLDKLLKTAEDEFTELLREKQKPASPQQRKP